MGASFTSFFQERRRLQGPRSPRSRIPPLARLGYNSRRMSTLDTFGRAMRDLRISVTDRCNFRCTYCMPFDEYKWIERQEVLSFEEIERLVRVFLPFGIQKVRLTGGEPLVRKDLDRLIARLSAKIGRASCRE